VARAYAAYRAPCSPLLRGALLRGAPRPPLLPYPPLFRSGDEGLRFYVDDVVRHVREGRTVEGILDVIARLEPVLVEKAPVRPGRSEGHTSELQSRENLVCRLLLEKKKTPAVSAGPATELA